MLNRRSFPVGISGFDFYLSRCDTDQITLCLVVDIEVRVTSFVRFAFAVVRERKPEIFKAGCLMTIHRSGEYQAHGSAMRLCLFPEHPAASSCLLLPIQSSAGLTPSKIHPSWCNVAMRGSC
jgi:hypothetical protein